MFVNSTFLSSETRNFNSVCRSLSAISISGFIGYFRLSVVDAVARALSTISLWSKLRRNLDDICDTFGDISILLSWVATLLFSAVDRRRSQSHWTRHGRVSEIISIRIVNKFRQKRRKTRAICLVPIYRPMAARISGVARVLRAIVQRYLMGPK